MASLRFNKIFSHFTWRIKPRDEMCWQEDENTCRHCLTVNLFIPARRRVVARETLNLNKIFIKSYARCKLSLSLLLFLHSLPLLLLHFLLLPFTLSYSAVFPLINSLSSVLRFEFLERLLSLSLSSYRIFVSILSIFSFENIFYVLPLSMGYLKFMKGGFFFLYLDSIFQVWGVVLSTGVFTEYKILHKGYVEFCFIIFSVSFRCKFSSFALFFVN